MNAKLRFLGLATAGLLAAGSAAFAQPSAPMPAPGAAWADCPMVQGAGMGPRQGMRGQGFDPARAEVRVAALATALKLQPNQQAAWDAFAGKMKSQYETRAKMRADMVAVGADRQKALELRAEHMKTNGAALSELAQARAALVAELSPEQKATLDNFGHGQVRGHGHGCGHGPHRGGYGPAV
ncbi:MAG: Spy/CpxP family protein refolding chaperone [Burkholderiaceae bacterium]